MAYRFPLATLLRLREIAEEKEERALGQILRQIAQVRGLIADLGQRRARLIGERERALAGQLAAVDLHTRYAQVVLVEEKIKQAERELAELETRRVNQLAVYEDAHRKKELLEGMRTEQIELYRKGQAKREQDAADDNFISRRAR